MWLVYMDFVSTDHQNMSPEMSGHHLQEVTDVVRDALSQRVKQCEESLYSRRQPKHKNVLAPASPLFVKGNSFTLVANFMKRHSNLRCIARQRHGDLRVFPERYVVCVSCPEDASAHHGNPSLATTEQSEQSRSEYFSRAGETQDPLTSAAKTKKIALQKIAKQASVQLEEIGQRAALTNQTEEQRAAESSPNKTASSSEQKVTSAVSAEARAHTDSVGNKGQTPEEQAEEKGPSHSSEYEGDPGTNERWNVGEDLNLQGAKRRCLGRPPVLPEGSAPDCSTQTSKPGFLTPLPPVEDETGSKAFPEPEWKKTTLEVELLTLGKQAQRLPLASNNTAQTNQNRLPTSLRGQSVKPASSGSSIASRSTLGENGSENAPRTSRLRRMKRS
uniref:SLX4 interacting protein n=1 Tax=Takifugu rubripes TaxID=31033 RepID=A0A674N7M6_TAKRU